VAVEGFSATATPTRRRVRPPRTPSSSRRLWWPVCIVVVAVAAWGKHRQRRAARAGGGPSSASPSCAAQRAKARGRFRAARFQASSKRTRLAWSASDRTLGGRGAGFPPPIRPPPLPTCLTRPIADGGVVAAAASVPTELLAGVEGERRRRGVGFGN
jgi:hypothetical protein